jgi:hypothetical protein
MDFFCLLTEELLKKKTKHLTDWVSEMDFVLHSSEAAKIMHRKVFHANSMQTKHEKVPKGQTYSI